ncbi:MAG: glycosyltransferase [Chloroflexi bacterium]|nr:glycosyltransferase [Chloroflexota bacterium]
MKILYVNADRGAPVQGHKGAAVHVRAMINAFARLGHHITLVAARRGPSDGPAPRARLIEVAPPKLRPKIGDAARAKEWQAQAHAQALQQAIAPILENEAYDFIYERYSLWSDAGAKLARMTGAPLVLEVNSPLRREASLYRQLFDDALAARIERDQFQAAHTIVVVSEALARYVIERGARPESVLVLPNAVDPERFHPAVRGGAVHHRYGLRERTIIGFVGRVRPWHDMDALLAAFALLYEESDRYHLLLVGETPEMVRRKIVHLGLKDAVTLTGPIPHDLVPQYIAAMHVAVSTHKDSPDFYFSPLKLFEYMACARPVVAAALGQQAEIIRPGENGLLYRPGDPNSLADAIREMLSDPARARDMGWRAAVDALNHHTWEKNAKAVLKRLQPRSLVIELPLGRKSYTLPLLDAKLRKRLYRATRPDLAAPLMKDLPQFQEKGPYRLNRVERIEVLKYKPRRRCVLAYEISAWERASGRPVRLQWVGKVFRDDRGLRLHRLQKALTRHGFGPDAADRIHVPLALGYLPKMRMQVQSREPGQTLNQLVGRMDVRPHVAFAARGLAKLHQTLAVPYEMHREMRWWSIYDELLNLERFAAELAHWRPKDADHIGRLYEMLRYWAADAPATPQPAPVHRDFYYSQVLFHEDRLTIIDLDLYAWGDPAIDVANFTAHLVMLGLDPVTGEQKLTEEIDLFLESYQRAADVDASFWSRYRFYEAATFFRLLHVVSTRPAWKDHYNALQQRLEALLLVETTP